MSDLKLTSVSGKIPVVRSLLPDTLDLLVGTWIGTGFNQIWRPANIKTNGNNPNPETQDRFLELNETLETFTFSEISKEIPNRGFDQQTDINLHGIDYVQKVSDANVKDSNGQPAGIHFETGIWLRIPPTDANPIVDVDTFSRMASIPHGVSINLQGTSTTITGAPTIAATSITPFLIGQPGNTVNFPESDLAVHADFRTPLKDIPNVTQGLLDNPNSFLQKGLDGKKVLATTTLMVSTEPLNPPPSGGGQANISFLDGVGGKPNARTGGVTSTFWIEEIEQENGDITFQLQYTQTVLLNFNGLSWPHVSVGTLQKK